MARTQNRTMSRAHQGSAWGMEKTTERSTREARFGHESQQPLAFKERIAKGLPRQYPKGRDKWPCARSPK